MSKKGKVFYRPKDDPDRPPWSLHTPQSAGDPDMFDRWPPVDPPTGLSIGRSAPPEEEIIKSCEQSASFERFMAEELEDLDGYDCPECRDTGVNGGGEDCRCMTAPRAPWNRVDFPDGSAPLLADSDDEAPPDF